MKDGKDEVGWMMSEGVTSSPILYFKNPVTNQSFRQEALDFSLVYKVHPEGGVGGWGGIGFPNPKYINCEFL